MLAVSSGLFKLCLINAGLACPGGTSKINECFCFCYVEMHLVRLIWRWCNFKEKPV